MHPPNSRPQSSFLGASTPMTLWIASSLYLHMGTSVAPDNLDPSTRVPLTVSAVPVAVTFAFLSHVRSPTAHRRRRQDWLLLVVSLSKQRLCDPVRNLLLLQLIPQLPTKGVPVAPSREPTLLLVQRPTCWTRPFTEASACSPAHGQIRLAQTCWTRSHSQC